MQSLNDSLCSSLLLGDCREWMSELVASLLSSQFVSTQCEDCSAEEYKLMISPSNSAPLKWIVVKQAYQLGSSVTLCDNLLGTVIIENFL